MDYNQYVATLQSLAVSNSNDAAFMTMLPSFIESAELRILRELDFLFTVTTDSSVSCTAGVRSITLPTSPRFVTLQQINVITPAATAPNSGTRHPLQAVSKDVLDYTWPNSTGSTLPAQWAMITDQTIILGPWPDASYRIEMVGTVRPTTLSPTNTTTYLSLYLPDLLIKASMIEVAAYQRNFGSIADDPKMAQTWQQQYDLAKTSSYVEELRKKFAGPAWSSMSATPTATANR